MSTTAPGAATLVGYIVGHADADRLGLVGILPTALHDSVLSSSPVV